MAGINVTLDCGELIAWASDLAASRIRSVLASSLNRAARSARKEAISVIARDIGVSPARVKPSVGKIIRASPGNLKASFVTSKSRIGIRNVAGATFAKGKGLIASTHRLTGGRSSALQAPKAFLLKTSAGGSAVMIRTGKGKGAIRAVYAEGVNTAMSQPNAAARQGWERDASANATREVSAGIQAALLSRPAPSDSSSDE
jgi:hypothetical protein